MKHYDLSWLEQQIWPAPPRPAAPSVSEDKEERKQLTVGDLRRAIKGVEDCVRVVVEGPEGWFELRAAYSQLMTGVGWEGEKIFWVAYE